MLNLLKFITMKQVLIAGLIFTIMITGCKKPNENPSCATPEEKLTASFKINNLVYDNFILEGNIIDFSNDSKNAVSYSWDFDNSITSTDKIPANQSFEPCGGVYNIKLTAKSKKGEIATSTQQFVVLCKGKNAHRKGAIAHSTHFSTEEIKNFLNNHK